MVKVWYRRNYVPLHQVTHRAIGDIPGCTPAQDVFVRIDEADMQAAVMRRADAYNGLVQDVVDGRLGFQEWKNHPIHKSDIPVTTIRNPSKPYQFGV